MKKVIYLKKGGKISLVAPSFGCTTEPYKTRLNVAIDNFKKMGFTVDEGSNIYLAKNATRSNSPKKCAEEFMDAYRSDSNVIFSVGGGETMCEILPYINFEEIKNLPFKFFVGFSDNTNLTYTLATISEIPTIYGPCAGSFAFKPYKYDTLDTLKLLEGKSRATKGYPYWERYYNDEKNYDPLAESNISEPKKIRTYPTNINIDESGRILGGCLDCLQTLCGTRFDKTKEYLEKYKDDGFIWLLESCDLCSLDIERALFQLKEAGWFKYCKTIIYGRPFHYQEEVLGVDHYKAIKTILSTLKIPYAIDADFGHFDPSMPFITGALARVQIKNNNIKIKYLDL
ncbi:MAG: S66 peptidase family protein [Bacilli bacterium]